MNPAAPEYGLRTYIYDHFLRSGTAPSVAVTARATFQSEGKVREGFALLAATGAITLDAQSGEIWRAAPFCAVPTGFEVEWANRRMWGTCAWDALGIPAMLHEQAKIRASCACCNQPMELIAGPNSVSGDGGVIHVAVPAREWYDDLVFT